MTAGRAAGGSGRARRVCTGARCSSRRTTGVGRGRSPRRPTSNSRRRADWRSSRSGRSSPAAPPSPTPSTVASSPRRSSGPPPAGRHGTACAGSSTTGASTGRTMRATRGRTWPTACRPISASRWRSIRASPTRSTSFRSSPTPSAARLVGSSASTARGTAVGRGSRSPAGCLSRAHTRRSCATRWPPTRSTRPASTSVRATESSSRRGTEAPRGASRSRASRPWSACAPWSSIEPEDSGDAGRLSHPRCPAAARRGAEPTPRRRPARFAVARRGARRAVGALPWHPRPRADRARRGPSARERLRGHREQPVERGPGDARARGRRDLDPPRRERRLTRHSVSRWVALAIVFVTRTSMGYQFQSVASVGPLLVPELGLAWAQLGTLIGVYMLPGAFFALPGGMLGQRLGERRTVVASLALMVAGGLVTAASHGFALAVSGRLLSGVGAVLMNVLLAKMVADWFAEGELTTATAIMLSSWPVGLGLAAATLGGVATSSSWRMAVATTAGAPALRLVLIAFAYRDPPPTQGSAAGPPARPARPSPREGSLALRPGFASGRFNASLVAVVAFGPAMLVARRGSLRGARFLVRPAVLGTIFFGA